MNLEKDKTDFLSGGSDEAKTATNNAKRLLNINCLYIPKNSFCDQLQSASTQGVAEVNLSFVGERHLGESTNINVG